MADSGNKSLSMLQVAKALFRTAKPNSEQIHQVIELVNTGVLQANTANSRPARWTTTESALAEYLAQREVDKATRCQSMEHGERKRRTADTVADTREQPSELHDVYHSIWREYFLAVMLRRRIAHRSAAFRRAVLGGQVLLLLAMIGTCLMTFSQISGFLIAPAEHQAIERWIDSQTDAYAIKQWHPTAAVEDSLGSIIEVEYRYRKDSPRWIHTERIFHVVGDSVTELQAED